MAPRMLTCTFASTAFRGPQLLRGAWEKRGFSYEGEFYRVADLQLDPPPTAPSDDRLALLQTNEGYASRLIGSPATILDRIREFQELGVDCLTVLLYEERSNCEVLPELTGVAASGG